MSNTTAVRFWAKVDKFGQNGCWLWTAALDPAGYGRFKEAGRGGLVRLAHRIAYQLVVGPIPTGLQLDHLCRVRRCVNPAHLEPVTSAENTRRGIHHNSNKTHCLLGHAYTAENTYTTPRGSRECRICRAAKDRQRRQPSLNHAHGGTR